MLGSRQFFSILLAALPVTVDAAMVGKSIPTTEFGLFAYGDGIGGLPVVFANGMAFVGDPRNLNVSDAAQVIFTASTTDSTALVANPNTTSIANSTTSISWSNLTYYLPDSSTTNRQTGFSNSTTVSGAVTDGFWFYGTTAMQSSSSGLVSLWYATEAADRVFSLNWNSTADSSSNSGVPVTLKTTPPSFPATKA